MTTVLAELTRLRDMLRLDHLTDGWTFVEGCVKCESIKGLESLIEQESTQPEAPITESLDFNRLRSGDRRAMFADHQDVFDRYYAALDASLPQGRSE